MADVSPSNIKHLPYEIDEGTNRFFYYENLWKREGLNLLLKHCDPRGMSLLDYGCGRGECLQMAKEAGLVVLGTDVDPECVRLGARYGPTCALNTEDPVSQFGPKSFDVIACFHVLEHVENPKRVLRTIATIARSYVILAVPNLGRFHGLHERPELGMVNEGHLQSWDHCHLLGLARATLRTETRGLGYGCNVHSFLEQSVPEVPGNKIDHQARNRHIPQVFPVSRSVCSGLVQDNITCGPFLEPYAMPRFSTCASGLSQFIFVRLSS